MCFSGPVNHEYKVVWFVNTRALVKAIVEFLVISDNNYLWMVTFF